MATYIVGDIQGCCDALQRLLEKIRFDSSRDELWCTGDLVNRGPESLEVLRFVRRLGDSAVCVLGNHDLHLLALAAGNPRHRNAGSLSDVLTADDRDELLLHQPRDGPAFAYVLDQRLRFVLHQQVDRADL